MQQKRWTITPKSTKSTKELEEKLGLSKELVELLHQREVYTFEEAQTFFRPQLEHIHDPLLMKDMDEAVVRVFEAFEKEEKILFLLNKKANNTAISRDVLGEKSL